MSESSSEQTNSICIFVATVTGNAELVAEDVSDGLDSGAKASGGEVDSQIRMMDDVELDDLMNCHNAVFVSSTYGVGDVPDNSLKLYTALMKERPDLKHLRYGAISLGDSTYDETFAFGGRKWDDVLTECGATRIGDLLVLDASSTDDPQDLSIEWATHWWSLI